MSKPKTTEEILAEALKQPGVEATASTDPTTLTISEEAPAPVSEEISAQPATESEPISSPAQANSENNFGVKRIYGKYIS